MINFSQDGLQLGPATVAAHDAAVATLIGATTTAELAAALATWQHLDEPGFANDLPDGRYYDGVFFAVKRGRELAATKLSGLHGVLVLWSQLAAELRADTERAEVVEQVGEPNRGGRPAVGKPLLVRMPDWRRAMTKADAAAAGISEAELVRWLVGQAYEHLTREAGADGVSRTDLIRDRIARR